MKRLISLVFVLALLAQEVSGQTPRAVWDQAAASQVEVNAMSWTIGWDIGTPTAGTALLTSVTCTGQAPAFVCTAFPIPAEAAVVGRKVFVRGTLNGLTSEWSLPHIVANTEPQPDPKCTFPTGSAAVFIMPIRLLHGGTQTSIYFQMSSPGAPINQIRLYLARVGSTRQTTPFKVLGDPTSPINLLDVAALRFERPTASAATPAGTYTVWIEALNNAGCSALTNAPYQFIIQ